MKDIKYWIRKGQHVFSENTKRVISLYQLKWLRIATVIIVVLVVFQKNINISINLFSPQKKEYVEQQISLQEPIPVIEEDEIEEPIEEIVKIKKDKHAGSLFDEEPEHLFRHVPTQADTNLANTFSNLGFILNPNLAKKLKVSSKVVAIKKKKCKDYIDTFSPIAVEEMKQFGIPASVTLAQGLLESNVGDSKLAVRNNNHFGIKCFSTKCKRGHCTNYTDDSHKDFFRKYSSAWESYREHSKFLQRPRYAHLKKLGTKDYKNWAHGLRKAGYATDKKYAYKLIKIIEIMELDRFDEEV